MSEQHHSYVTPNSYWPILGSISLACIAVGTVMWLHERLYSSWIVSIGFVLLALMMFGWFRDVIEENRTIFANDAINEVSFRQGMMWFIFTEVMFFLVLFSVLWYVRLGVLPWLSGQADYSNSELTHYVLWPDFQAAWPLMKTPDPSKFVGPKDIIDPWHIPAMNTLILLSSGVTITIAHFTIIKNKIRLALLTQFATIVLGLIFLVLQAYEYWLAYTHDGLMLSSGIYGNIFYMLTGFHGLHVAIGTLMLIVILVRMYFGAFTSKSHFAFEAVSWYWHFVDVVWLALFVFVYWL